MKWKWIVKQKKKNFKKLLKKVMKLKKLQVKLMVKRNKLMLLSKQNLNNQLFKNLRNKQRMILIKQHKSKSHQEKANKSNNQNQ